MSDATLITSILGGNTEGFSGLVERYLPLVRGICASHIYDPAAQDDLVQESFLAGYLGLNTLKNPERFGSWIARIARHKCMSWMRSRKRRENVQNKLAHEKPAAPPPADPVNEATRREMCEWARQSITELPENTREAMVLCYIEGYTLAEAARFLEVREDAIKKRLQYGRQLVGEKMLGQFGEPPAKKKTDHLKNRIIMALPLATIPWKAAAGEAAAAGASAAGFSLFAKIAALVALVLTLIGSGIAIHQYTARDASATKENSNDNTELNVAVTPVDGQGNLENDAEETSEPAPTGTGELTLFVRYRMQPLSVAQTPVTVRNDNGEAVVLPQSEWPLVPDATVLLKPLRPDRQVQKMLFEDTGLDPRMAKLLIMRAEGGNPSNWKELVDKEGLTPEVLVREKEKLLALRDTHSVKGIEKLFERLISPVPSRDWITGKSSHEGKVVFASLPAGPYRVEVVMSGVNQPAIAQPKMISRPKDDAEQTNTGRATTVDASTPHMTSGKLDVQIVDDAKTGRTLFIADTVSAIQGRVVDAETRAPVGDIALSVTGEAVCHIAQRLWVKADGSFHLPPDVTGFGAFTVEGRPQGFIPVNMQGMRQVGEPTHLTVLLKRRPTLSGYVRQPDGSPVVGINIMRRDIDGSGASGAATTDDDGFYSISHDGGLITLYASGTMSQSEHKSFELEADESAEFDFLMPATGRAIFDIRTEAGEIPARINGASLRTENASLSGTVLKRQGDLFVIPYLKPGDYQLTFAIKGYETVSHAFTISADLADVDCVVALVESNNTLTVQVLDAEGELKSGASCNLMLVIKKYNSKGQSTGMSSSSIARQKTDEEGLAVFEGLASGFYNVYCGNANQEVTLPHEETVVLKLKPRKVEPGVLYLDIDKEKAFDALRNHLPLDLDADNVRVICPSGRLSRRAVEAGDNMVFAFKAGYPPASTVVTVSEARFKEITARRSNVFNEPVEFVFGEAGSLHGVVDAAKSKRSSPLDLLVFPEAIWRRMHKEATSSSWHTFGRLFAGGAKTAGDGTFRIRFLPPGRYVVTSRYSNASDTVEVAAGRETGPVTIKRK